jgi:hypothetical protein
MEKNRGEASSELILDSLRPRKQLLSGLFSLRGQAIIVKLLTRRGAKLAKYQTHFVNIALVDVHSARSLPG